MEAGGPPGGLRERSIPTGLGARGGEADRRSTASGSCSSSRRRPRSTAALAEEPKNAGVLAGVLHEVTGRRLALAFEVGEAPHEEPEAEEEPATEDEFISLFKTTFDAREIGKETDCPCPWT